MQSRRPYSLVRTQRSCTCASECENLNFHAHIGSKTRIHDISGKRVKRPIANAHHHRSTHKLLAAVTKIEHKLYKQAETCVGCVVTGDELSNCVPCIGNSQQRCVVQLYTAGSAWGQNMRQHKHHELNNGFATMQYFQFVLQVHGSQRAPAMIQIHTHPFHRSHTTALQCALEHESWLHLHLSLAAAGVR